MFNFFFGTPRDHLQTKIEKLCKEGKIQDALNQCDQYLVKHGQDRYAFTTKAQLLLANEKYELALDAANNSLLSQENNSILDIRCYALKAQIYVRKGNKEDANTAIENGLAVTVDSKLQHLENSSRSDLLICKAILHWKFEFNLEDALSAINMALSLDSLNMKAMYMKSKILFAKNDLDRALEYIKEILYKISNNNILCISKNDMRAGLLLIKALISRKNNHIEEAIPMFTEAFNISNSMEEKGLAGLFLGKYDWILHVIDSFSSSESQLLLNNKKLMSYYHWFTYDRDSFSISTSQIQALILSCETYTCNTNDNDDERLKNEAIGFGYAILGQKDKAIDAFEKVLRNVPGESFYDYTPLKYILNGFKNELELVGTTRLSGSRVGLSQVQDRMDKIPIQIEGLTYQRVPGDGHCLYHAVGLYCNESQDWLRRVIATYLEENLDTYVDFIAGLLPSGQTINNYIGSIRNGKEWADNIEIEIAMRLLDRPIIIIGPNGSIQNPGQEKRFKGDPIFVYYNGYNHYDALLLEYEGSSRDLLRQLMHDTAEKKNFYAPQNTEQKLRTTPRDALSDYQALVERSINSVQDRTQNQQELKLFVETLSASLNKYYASCLALKNQSVARKPDTWDRAIQFVDQANYITGSLVGVEGTITMKALCSAYHKIKDRKEYEIANNFLKLASSATNMERLSREISSELAFKYQFQIGSLNVLSVSVLATCMAARMIQYVGSEEGKYSSITSTAKNWAKDKLNDASTSLVRLFYKNFSQKKLEITEPKVKLLRGVLFGCSDTDNDDLKLYSNELIQWTCEGVILKSGINANNKYYSGVDCSPEIYGYRNSTEEEAIVLNYEKKPRINLSIPLESTEARAQSLFSETINLTKLKNVSRRNTSPMKMIGAFVLGVLLSMIFNYYYHADVPQESYEDNISGASGLSTNYLLIFSVCFYFLLVDYTDNNIIQNYIEFDDEEKEQVNYYSSLKKF